jgi:hypothetical protein
MAVRTVGNPKTTRQCKSVETKHLTSGASPWILTVEKLPP